MGKKVQIKKLAAWSPVVSGADELVRQAEYDSFLWKQSATYEAKGIPKPHARRMSSLSKLTIGLANEAIEGQSFDSAVFATRYGELANTVDLIKMLSSKEELSPTKFSQSVHNTASGLFSIISGAQVPMQLVSSSSDTFISGLISSISFALSAPGSSVLFVYSDDIVPEVLYPHADEVDRDKIGVAMIISSEGSGVGISLTPNENVECPSCSQSSSFLQQLFIENSKSIRLPSRGMEWQINVE